MSAIDQLIAYILKLTSEQINSIIEQPPTDGTTKDEYILKIIALLKECNDITLLDLVYRLLGKSL